MLGPETAIAFVMASFAVAIVPGPSNLYVLARTVAHGRRAGFLSAAGLALGALTHALAAALGVSAVLAVSPPAFAVVQYAGAAYLVGLGVAMVVRGQAAPTAEADPVAPRPPNERRIVLQAALTEILNPKVALFFIAFLPQFVDPAAGPAALQLLVLGIAYALIGLPCDAAVAIGGHSLVRTLLHRASVRRALEWACGTVLVGLGVRLALSSP